MPASSAARGEQSSVPTAGAWKARLEDPFNRYRAPLARLVARGLVRAGVAPGQITLVQPFLAALAGYFVTFPDATHLALGVLLFEARSILQCVDSAKGIDRTASALSAFFLYAGIFWHFHLHPPPFDGFRQYLSVSTVLLLALILSAVFRAVQSALAISGSLSSFRRERSGRRA